MSFPIPSVSCIPLQTLSLPLLFLIIFFCGANQATTNNNLSTTIIKFYSLQKVQKFDPSAPYIQSLLSVASLIGCFVGSLASTYLVARLGRRTVALASAALAVLFNSFVAIPVSWWYLFIIKIFVGIPTAIMSTIYPGWLSELATVQQRGLITVFNEVGLTVGYVFSSLAFLAIGNDSKAWFIAFTPAIFCCVIEFVATFFIKETIATFGNRVPDLDKQDERETSLLRVKFLSWGELFTRKYRKVLIVAFLLGVAQQGTGKNAIVQYATKIFQNVFKGIGQTYSSTCGSLFVTGISLIFCLGAMPLVNRIGRRWMLFGGFGLCILGLIMFIICYAVNNNNPNEALLLTTSIVFFLGYEIGPASIFYVLTGEIYPINAKPKASGIGFCMKWVFQITVSLIFPYFQNYQWGVYTIFLFICSVPVCVLWFFIPETKGRTLKQIEEVMVVRGEEGEEAGFSQ